MEQKGLFELFFVLIMLVLIYPVATHKNTIITSDLLTQADQFALLTDLAISDALADGAFEGCKVTNITNNIPSYLTILRNEFNTLSGIKCDYYDSQIIFSCLQGDCQDQKIKIKCVGENSNSKTTITKEITLNKKVTAVESPGYCNVTVRSGSPFITHVDYNLSYP